jgi:hypothetical protein
VPSDQRFKLRFRGFVLGAFFNAHVLEFAGLKDFAALKAFHEFGIFVSAHNLHPWMFARLLAGVRRSRKRLGGHKYGNKPLSNTRGTDSREFPGILCLPFQLSSPSVLPSGEFFPAFVKLCGGQLARTETPTNFIAKA